MKKLFAALLLVAVVTLTIHLSISQRAVQQKLGPLADGGFLLNSGWTIRPAGQQTEVGTFPMCSALSRNGKYLLVMNAGYDPPHYQALNTASKAETRAGPGKRRLARPPDRPPIRHFYVGGGTTGKVLEFSLDPDTGAVTPKRELQAVEDLAIKAPPSSAMSNSRAKVTTYTPALYGDSIPVARCHRGQISRQLENRPPPLSHYGRAERP